jgi:hypothetical protein
MDEKNGICGRRTMFCGQKCFLFFLNGPIVANMASNISLRKPADSKGSNEFGGKGIKREEWGKLTKQIGQFWCSSSILPCFDFVAPNLSHN